MVVKVYCFALTKCIGPAIFLSLVYLVSILACTGNLNSKLKSVEARETKSYFEVSYSHFLVYKIKIK